MYLFCGVVVAVVVVVFAGGDKEGIRTLVVFIVSSSVLLHPKCYHVFPKSRPAFATKCFKCLPPLRTVVSLEKKCANKFFQAKNIIFHVIPILGFQF